MSSVSLNIKKGIDSLAETIRHPKINKWLMGLLVAIPLAGGLSYLAYNQLVTAAKQQAQSKIQTAAVTRGNLTVLVSANGTVQPESSVNVSPKTSGVLKRLLVKEGDFVKLGQIVAYMDNSNLQGQLLQAQGNVAAAQANLNKPIAGNRSQDIAGATAQLAEATANSNKVIAGNRSQDIAGAKANLNKVQATYRQAAEDLRRNQQLRSQGAISQQALSTARSTSDSAQAQVEQAQQSLNLLNAGSRPEDIAQARSVVNQRQHALDLLKADLALKISPKPALR